MESKSLILVYSPTINSGLKEHAIRWNKEPQKKAPPTPNTFYNPPPKLHPTHEIKKTLEKERKKINRAHGDLEVSHHHQSTIKY